MPMFENMPDTSVMVPRPDSNTAEAILYGDEYKFYKSAMWWWDAVRNELEKQLDVEMSKLQDPEFCLYVLERRPSMIWSKQPPMNEIDKLRDLRQLREVIRRGTALRNLEVRRANNEMYAKLMGIDKHVREVREGGVSETMWMAATSGRNQQIDFEMLREILDDDKLKAEAEAEEIGLSIAERRKENERFQKEYDEYLRSRKEEMDPQRAMESEEQSEPEPEPFNIEDVSIFRDAADDIRRREEEYRARNDPGSEEYWGSDPGAEGEGHGDASEEGVPGWVSAPAHDRIRRGMSGWYMDDMDWFLSEMGVCS